MAEYLVGVQNSIGEEYVHCNSKKNAHATIEDFLREGYAETDIIVYKAIFCELKIKQVTEYSIAVIDPEELP